MYYEQKKRKGIAKQILEHWNTTDIMDNSTKIANKFNEYFINIGPKLSKKWENVNKNTAKPHWQLQEQYVSWPNNWKWTWKWTKKYGSN